ncbi:MAG TPA: aminopeptidase P family protein [Tahibacter sp.]|uniref:aminopeptidase P family protein n=1 Tax=Tahibacter sp. TaxID=2056211 RepID=UPI002CDA7669|nr:aminopeptidase P family protein [Tahibacter sp.]HSX62508.1 aminopeptidase P family protein [Tahibacter sp.]
MSTSERLRDLRAAMQQHGVDAVVVPSADPHLSEYLPDRWKTRRWLSGFSGSTGTLVVTADFAGVWTDSRYFEQAEQELSGSGIRLMRLGAAQSPEHLDWLCERLVRGQTVAVPGDVLSVAMHDVMRPRLSARGIALRTDLDLVDDVWTDRPPLPAASVREHDPGYVSSTRSERLARVRAAMAAAGATHHLVSSLDDVAWITNLRGSDVPYNPVFLAHLLIGPDNAILFVPAGKIPSDLGRRLGADGIVLADYAAAKTALATLGAGDAVLLDPRRVVHSLAAAIAEEVTLVPQLNPSQRFKAIKTPAELRHIGDAMREDGVALVRFLIWLETTLGSRVLTELDIAAELKRQREARPGFVGESFATIAGYMANGALPHYHATDGHYATLAAEGLLLVDSGGQYEGGTTDVTRTIALGALTGEQRRDYTLVLKGMIALSRARFPRGTTGQQLDALARAPIWAEGINYGHGTGHGVGYFLNVHEGPHAIRPPVPGETGEALAPGMVTSNEPGIYRPGRHGVRLENLIATVPAGDGEFGEFLAFDTLTLCPIDVRPIEIELLSARERDWLDWYHAKVEAELAPLLDADEQRWLSARCAALGGATP